MTACIRGVALLSICCACVLVSASSASGAAVTWATGQKFTLSGGADQQYLFTPGQATRSQITLYHSTSSSPWFISYCVNGQNSGCMNGMGCTGISPCVDGSGCSYCWAQGQDLGEATGIQWTLISYNV
jgi:hypothetical protein